MVLEIQRNGHQTTDELPTAEGKECLSPEELQRLEAYTPKRRAGSPLISSCPSASSPGI